MKKIKVLSTALLCCLTLSLVLIACKKESSLSAEEIAQAKISSESEEDAEGVFDEIFDNVVGVNDELGLGTGVGVFGRAANGGNYVDLQGRGDSAGHCFTLTITPLQMGVFPKTVTIDFGTGCLGRDGKTRKGKIVTVYTGRLVVPGSSATTTFVDYYVDSAKIQGTHTLTNQSTSAGESFNVKVQNGKITVPSGNYIAWNKNKTWTKIGGSSTPLILADDVFSITGVTNGTVSYNGNTVQWSTEILQPLIRKFICRWIVEGQKRITRNGHTGVIDYGNGTCDNLATLSINGNTFNITLH
jgi:hypothetical protein